VTIVRRALDAVESWEQVDAVAAPLQRRVASIVRRTGAYPVLGGEWMGHPVHPIAVQVPLGLWISSAVLDLLPGQEDAARRLVGAGLLAVPAAAVAGAVDWSELDPRARRVGVVHAVANIVASTCYVRSYRSRRRGRRAAGRLWAVLGLAAVSVGGALGGHLAYAQGSGVFRWYGDRWPARQVASEKQLRSGPPPA